MPLVKTGEGQLKKSALRRRGTHNCLHASKLLFERTQMSPIIIEITYTSTKRLILFFPFFSFTAATDKLND